MIVILTGVCGCGKTTIGHALANELRWVFADGDDYHPDSNKLKMAGGIPLTDEDRIPWLLSLHDLIVRWQDSDTSGIIACSALKAFYRKILTDGLPSQNELGPIAPSNTEGPAHSSNIDVSASGCHGVLLVLLRGSYELLCDRLKRREGHFMPVSLLRSQLDTLEPPDETTLVVDVTLDVREIVRLIIVRLNELDKQSSLNAMNGEPS